MEFVIITGMSGAGKSQAVKALEDIGYYCMDNLPPMLLPKFAHLCITSKKDIEKVALVVDIRGGIFFDDLFTALDEIKDMGLKHRILFLDAKNKVLIKRYKELRRPHPLSQDSSLIDGIEAERKILEKVKETSDYIIDTSNFTIGMLKEEINNIFYEGKRSKRLTILMVSFGFKHGILLDGDLIFDVRFLPNPHYIEEIKSFSGLDKEVKDYVFSFDATNTFIDKLLDLLEYLIPHYIKEGKTNLVIGIGCTGGKHRSVAISEELSRQLVDSGYRTIVKHRDKGEW